jgi:hypothetical protein
MRALRLFIVAVLLVSSPGLAYFYSGNQLVGWMREYERFDRGDLKADHVLVRSYMSFVAGVHDTGDEILFCTPQQTTVGQVCAVVAKYLQANPERWDKSANFLVLDALTGAFPCQATKGAKRKGASL